MAVNTLYDFSLVVALALMLFFAVYFLTAKTLDKPVFGNYIRSRRIMGGGDVGAVCQLHGSPVVQASLFPYGRGYIDEPVDLFPRLLAVLFRLHDAARQGEGHPSAIRSKHAVLDAVHRNIGNRSAVFP